MTILPGTRLGPYEVIAPLGAGGMGEVWKARDARLGREVAIKVLPADVASDPSRLKRFEKEARAASALNHPNIVTIYDFGSADSVSWIAMEKVDGKTLRELLFSGPLPVKKLLQIAPQIADGLARAHEAGIVHRDLKPENVMVTKDGLVKILDFGLAKRTGTGSGSDEASHLPTETGTSPGMILGTVGYMSPEQAAGQPVDFRSDQFAFGSILYEMATGKRTFFKKTGAETLSAIITEEPVPIASLNPQVPTQLRWIVERCLAKEVRQRYSSTDDLARDLATLRDHLSEAASGVAPATGAKRRGLLRSLPVPLLAAVGGALFLVAAGVFVERWIAARAISPQVPSFTRITFHRGNAIHGRFAPDGRTVVYGAAWDGAPAEVFTVRTDSTESRPVGVPHSDLMSVSSKSELAILLKKTSLSFGGLGTLARIPLNGGAPRELLEDVAEADWAPNGEDLAIVRRGPNGKNRLEYPVGTVLAEADWFASMRVSPKGDLIAYVGPGAKSPAIKTIDRKGSRKIISDGWGGIDSLAWSPRGDEIWFVAKRSSKGVARDWAIRAVSLAGSERVLLPVGFDVTLHDVSFDGRLLVEQGVSHGGILCKPRGESRERELGRLDWSVVTDISEDGKLILFREQGAGLDQNGIYLRKTDGTPAIRVGEGHSQGISPDGRWVMAIRKGPPQEIVMIPTGPGAEKRISLQGLVDTGSGMLPNGRGFFVTVAGKDGEGDSLYILGPEGGKPTLVRTGGIWDLAGSPDASRLVFATKDRHLMIAPFLGGDGTPIRGAATPLPGAPLESGDELGGWSSEGRYLYIARHGEIPARIDRLELATGRRETWKKFLPEDSVGIIDIGPVLIAPDGQSYAYSYLRELVSDFFIIDGLK